MSELMLYLVIGLFLPLFPFSMVFNVLYARSRLFMVRGLLLLLWPQFGLALLAAMPETSVPGWIAPLALATSALYAFRTIAVRELGQWSGYLATSLWALTWLFIAPDESITDVTHLHVLGMSLPLILLARLGAGLEQRFGAAYTGLYGGLAQSLPRFSAILVLVVLAVIATPLFPSFITLTLLVFREVAIAPWFAVTLLGVWFVWTWSGMRLIQGLVVGPAEPVSDTLDVRDISLPVTWLYTGLLTALAAGGFLILGGYL